MQSPFNNSKRTVKPNVLKEMWTFFTFLSDLDRIYCGLWSKFLRDYRRKHSFNPTFFIKVVESAS